MINIVSAADNAPNMIQQVQAFMLGFSAVVASIYGLWKIKPTRTLILRLVRSTTQSATDWIDKRIHQGALAATRDIRSQVLPGGGESSMMERSFRLELELMAANARIREIQDELEYIANKLKDE